MKIVADQIHIYPGWLRENDDGTVQKRVNDYHDLALVQVEWNDRIPDPNYMNFAPAALK